jgi:hypothetical protein
LKSRSGRQRERKAKSHWLTGDSPPGARDASKKDQGHWTLYWGDILDRESTVERRPRD